MRPRDRTKVLLLTPAFPPSLGGVQLVMHRLVRNWTRIEARVVTLDEEGARSFDSRERLEVVRVSGIPGTGRRSAITTLNLVGAVDGLRKQPHVVLSAYVNVSLAARAIKRLAGIPFVQYVHGRELFVRSSLSHFAIQGADAVVANSKHTETVALECGADPTSIHCIMPGVDLPDFGGSARFKLPTVVVVARLDERYKGHDVLIRAMPLVRARIPGARLVIIGDGVLRVAYRNLVDALGLGQAVMFLGPVEDEQRDWFVSRSHVYAMPTRLSTRSGFEGFGIAYLEAGAHGLPVVAGRVAGALDAVIDGETGLLVDPTDHVAVAHAIAQLLSNPAEAERLGRAGRERARDFAWPKVAERVEDVLLAVAGRGR